MRIKGGKGVIIANWIHGEEGLGEGWCVRNGEKGLGYLNFLFFEYNFLPWGLEASNVFPTDGTGFIFLRLVRRYLHPFADADLTKFMPAGDGGGLG